MRYSVNFLCVFWLVVGGGCGDDQSNSNVNSNVNNANQRVCGNGLLEDGEQCDNGSENSDSVVDACRTDCRTAYCGDGIADTTEVCDGEDLENLQCSDVGHTGGQLTCSPTCQLDESGCSDCGDDLAEADEECDGDDLQSGTCATVTSGVLPDGDLECATQCVFDTSVCHDCGNGVIEGSEVCDGTALGARDCTTEGFNGGVLGCDATSGCLDVDTTSCTTCGDGICQFELGEDRASCWQDCDLWAQVTVGIGHTCAMLLDGSVWCWGSNSDGQLGTGSYAPAVAPTHVAISGIVNISAGYQHSCAVDYTGQVWCWGKNADGQLGDLSNTPSYSPVPVHVFNQATQVSCGTRHTCALKSDGTVWCWGSNSHGQLGAGTESSSAPVQVTTISGAVDVSARSDRTSCAVTSTGDVFCWGGNQSYQFGRTTPTESTTPLQVPNLAVNIASVTLGGAADGSGAYGVHTCAIDGGGDIRCWGANNQGTLGINSSDAGPFAQPQLLPVIKAVYVTGGIQDSQATCAIQTSGQLACWGWNVRGEMGDGTTTKRLAPVDVPGMTDVISAGISFHGCAVQGSGALYCWGHSSSGQLGIGAISAPDDCFSYECVKSPQSVSTPPP